MMSSVVGIERMVGPMREPVHSHRTPPPHLAVNDVSKSFQTKRGPFVALDGVKMHVETNELVCVIGASGSGKSTLLKIIAGLTPPSNGVVLVDGQPVIGPGPDRGMVFQNYTLYPWL